MSNKEEVKIPIRLDDGAFGESIERDIKLLDQLSSSSKGASGSIGDVAGAASSLPGPMGAVATQLTRTIGLVRQLCGSGLLWFLAAAAAGWEYLTWSMRRTVEGEEELSVATSKMSQRLENVKDLAGSVGRSLWDMASSGVDALGSLASRGGSYIEDLLSRLNRLSGGLAGKALNFVTPSWLQGGVSAAGWALTRNVDAAGDLQRRENEQWRAKVGFMKEEAELNARISELRAKSYDQSVGEAERARAVRDAIAATNELYDKRIALAKEDEAIARERAELSDSDKSTVEEVARLEAARVSLEGQRQDALRALLRMDGRMQGSEARDARREASEALKQREALFALAMSQSESEGRARLAAQRAQEAARIAAIADDGARERAELEHQHALRLDQIAQQAASYRKANYEAAKQEYEAAHPGGTYSSTAVGRRVASDGNYSSVALTSSQSAEIEALLAEETALMERAARERADQLIRAHQSYTQRKAEIDKQYQADVEAIEAAITDAETRGDAERVAALKASRAEAEHTRAQAQSELSFRQLQELPEYTRAFEDLNRTSTETLTYLIGEFKRVKQAAGRDLDPSDLKAYTDAIERMQASIDERNPFAALSSSMSEILAARSAYSDARSDVARWSSSVEELTGRVAELESRLKSEALTGEELAEVEGSLSSAQGLLTEASESYADALSRARSAQDELLTAEERRRKAQAAAADAIAQLGSAIRSVGDALGGEEGKVLDFIGDVLSFTNTVVTAIQATSSTATGVMKAVESASAILAIISAAIQLMKELDELLPDAYKKYEEFANKQKEINSLTEAVYDYKVAVLSARQAEESWFSNSGLHQLQDQWELSSAAFARYQEVYNQQQAIYENESGNGWLGKFAYWTNPATWLAKLTGAKEGMSQWLTQAFGASLFGLEGMLGELGINLTQKAGVHSPMDFAGGLTSAFNNLRIETRKASKGFLGTGIGGHSQQTEDLREWVKANLPEVGDLFDADGMIDKAAYEAIMENYKDKLVGETEATLTRLYELREEWDKYLDELNEYVSQLYAPVVDNMSQAVWDWYDNGTDMMDSYKEYASDTFRSVADEFIKEMIRTEVVQPYMDMIREAYELYSKGAVGEGYLLDEVARAADDMGWKFEQEVPVLERMVELIGSKFEEAGYTFRSSAGEISSATDGIRSALSSLETNVSTMGKNIRQAVYEYLVESLILGSDRFKEAVGSFTEALSESIASGDLRRMQQDADEFSRFMSYFTDETQRLARGLGLATTDMEESLLTLGDNIRASLESGSFDASRLTESLRQQYLGQIASAFALTPADEQALNDIGASIVRALSEPLWGDDVWESELSGLFDSLYDVIGDIGSRFDEVSGVTSSVSTPFDDMRDSILGSLMDVEQGAENFVRNMRELLVKDMIEKMVLDAIEIDVRSDGQPFYGYDAWQRQWLEDYAGAMKRGDREALESLLSEARTVQEILASEASEFTNSLLETTSTAGDTTFSDLTDGFVDALMDMDMTADEWGEQIGEHLVRRLVEQMLVADMIQPLLDDLQVAVDSALGTATRPEEILADAGVAGAIAALQQAFPGLQSTVQGLMSGFRVPDDVAEAAATDNPFSSLKDELVDALMDADATAETFGERIGRTLSQQMLARVIDDRFGERITGAMDALYSAMESGDASRIAAAESAMEALYAEVDSATAAITAAQRQVEATVSRDEIFSGMKDEFVSTLMDMESSTAAFASNVSDTITRAFIEKFVLGDAFDARVEAWTDEYERIVRGDMSDGERERQLSALRDAIASAREDYTERVAALRDVLGTSEYADQSATVNMAEKATYDQFETYLGIAVAQQIAMEQGNMVREQILSTLQGMSALTSPFAGDEVTARLDTANGYLLDIMRSNAAIQAEIGGHLASIDAKLSGL